jgi:serine/threonine protein kinase
MAADHWKKVRDLFDQAVELPPHAQQALLDAACSVDPPLRAEVERLLARDARLTSEGEQDFLQTPLVRPLSGPGGAAADLSFLAPPSEPGALGRLDHYEVLEVVGRGGMGVVLRARDTKLLRIVALKVLAALVAASSTARQRFLREARAAAAVRDERVVTIYAVCDDATVPYLVMEFIDGCTLEALLRSGGSLEVKEILRIGIEVARGLAAAHQHGLIHRDVKPANILMGSAVQHVKLSDFGLARSAGDPSLTDAGIIAGTPLYMAPEQVAGEPIDVRADLFSLGSVLYELCTGQPAFQAATSFAVMRRICDETPRPIRELNPNVPEPLCRLIDRLHAKNPADRPASANEVADLLAGLQETISEPRTERSGVSGQPRVAAYSARRLAACAAPRKLRRLGAGGLVLLLAGLGLGEASGLLHLRHTVSGLFSPKRTLAEDAEDRTSKEAMQRAAAEAWEKSVADLPAEKQIEAVERRLRELNPEFRGKVDFEIRNGKVRRLAFLTDWVTDISPVRALKGLESLDCGGSTPRKGRLTDLTPLRGLRLNHLQCWDSQVSDLEPLRGMPLERLNCQRTKVDSLSPLEGMKLIFLTIQETSVSDLSPLRGMPLKWLDLYRARGIEDLLPLVGMPLEYLNVTGLVVDDLRPVSSLKNLAWLILDETRVTDLSPLRGLRPERISLRGTAITDLTPLMGMPLKQLRLDYQPEREAFVRSFPELQFVNEKPTAVFWKEVAGKERAPE